MILFDIGEPACELYGLRVWCRVFDAGKKTQQGEQGQGVPPFAGIGNCGHGLIFRAEREIQNPFSKVDVRHKVVKSETFEKGL